MELWRVTVEYDDRLSDPIGAKRDPILDPWPRKVREIHVAVPGEWGHAQCADAAETAVVHALGAPMVAAEWRALVLKAEWLGTVVVSGDSR